MADSSVEIPLILFDEPEVVDQAVREEKLPPFIVITAVDIAELHLPQVLV